MEKTLKLIVDEELFGLYAETFEEDEEWEDADAGESLREALLAGQIALGGDIAIQEEDGEPVLFVTAELAVSEQKEKLHDALMYLFRGYLDASYLRDYVEEHA